jgi:hypothetical protein
MWSGIWIWWALYEPLLQQWCIKQCVRIKQCPRQ